MFYSDVSPSAPLAVFLFLATGLCCFFATIALLLFWLRGQKQVAVRILLGTGVLLAGYFAVLLLSALGSHSRLLALGEEKHFCEVDCHLAYSVATAYRLSSLGTGAAQRSAAGDFYVVRLKTRFDETTIGPHRGNGPLAPNSRRISLVDSDGRRYLPSQELGDLATSRREFAQSTPLTQPLRPGQWYSTILVFDVPKRVSHPKLLIQSGDWETTLLIGHENAPLHGKIYLAIDRDRS